MTIQENQKHIFNGLKGHYIIRVFMETCIESHFLAYEGLIVCNAYIHTLCEANNTHTGVYTIHIWYV